MTNKLTHTNKKLNSSLKTTVHEIKKFVANIVLGLIPISVSMIILYFAPDELKLPALEYDLEFITLAFAVISSVLVSNISLDKAKQYKILKKDIQFFEIIVIIFLIAVYAIKKCFQITMEWYLPFFVWLFTVSIGIIDIVICNYKKEKRN